MRSALYPTSLPNIVITVSMQRVDNQVISKTLWQQSSSIFLYNFDFVSFKIAVTIAAITTGSWCWGPVLLLLLWRRLTLSQDVFRAFVTEVTSLLQYMYIRINISLIVVVLHFQHWYETSFIMIKQHSSWYQARHVLMEKRNDLLYQP